jgi:hypothetical protein
MAKVTVQEWAGKARRRLQAVVSTSISDVARAANVPTTQGGRMRVRTGFLRNSQAGRAGSMPSGPSEGPRITVNGVEYRDPMGSPSVDAELMRWRMDQPFYVGWTANYAKHREIYDGFLEAEMMRWSEHVNNAVRKHGD